MGAISEVYNMDCLDYMGMFEENHFDLIIADPPYNIGISDNPVRQKHTCKRWDCNGVNNKWFDEMFRVAKHCIIWGGNYFDLPPSKNFIIWDKKQPKDLTLAMCEFAWTDFDFPAKMFRQSVQVEKNKIHPTQKPVALYGWILDLYIPYLNKDKSKIKIYDPFLGSGSSRIACYKKGIDFYATEIDTDYYKAQNERFLRECKGEYKLKNGNIATQLNLFE